MWHGFTWNCEGGGPLIGFEPPGFARNFDEDRIGWPMILDSYRGIYVAWDERCHWELAYGVHSIEGFPQASSDISRKFETTGHFKPVQKLLRRAKGTLSGIGLFDFIFFWGFQHYLALSCFFPDITLNASACWFNAECSPRNFIDFGLDIGWSCQPMPKSVGVGRREMFVSISQ